jgi:hypothetical protein
MATVSGFSTKEKREKGGVRSGSWPTKAWRGVGGLGKRRVRRGVR